MTRRPRLTGAARAAERRRENLDIVLGVLGFFTALLFLATVLSELRGDQALGRAAVLAVMVGLVMLTLRFRRSLVRTETRLREAAVGTAGKSASTRG